MKSWDKDQFFKYTRMTVAAFEKLLQKIEHHIERQVRSDGISPEERLVIILRYLSQGTSMQALAWNFHVGHATVHCIVNETCQVLWNVLSPIYLKSPNTEKEWKDISDGFWSRWNFPNCIGALDGKHINIKAPARSAVHCILTTKKNFSIVLLAACDSAYTFTLVDIGAYGSSSDGGVFKNSVFGQRLEEDDMHVPKNSNLPFSNVQMPYFFVADEAFPLKKVIVRPYPGKNLSRIQRIFNYRLSRARQLIENTFGIFAARWRILKTNINAKVENVDNIVKAVVVLHNYCQTELSHNYCPPNYVDTEGMTNGGWRDEQTPLTSVDVGKVSWQEQIIDSGLLLN
ncbi:protein ALP1-like [Sitophilus oryzae]|uniref:Protein ALP1-like n=1 Tax=Sitophilus oryzae TaxID=7048 RepID=A0A6J2YWF1_SITOR|nr:protein ALP1-like [Sitophilus oryzae]